MLKLLWAWATVSFSTHPECLKAPFTSIWSFETFTSSEFSQLMLQQLRQVYTKSCNYKTANNLDYVQTSRCVHIHYVQTRHCVHIHYVQTSTFSPKMLTYAFLGPQGPLRTPSFVRSFIRPFARSSRAKNLNHLLSKDYARRNM